MQLLYLRVGQSKDASGGALVRAAVLAIFSLFGGLVTEAKAKHGGDTPQVTNGARPTVAQLVDSYFARLPDYRAGDLISQSQIVAVIRQIDAAGGEVKNARGIVDRGLPNSSFLIRELSSPAGKKFMRSVGQHQGGYARLDRLSSISGGQKIVRDLVRQPGGEKLVDYLTTTEGGSNLGHTLGGARGGVDLNQPTGRIYTASDLLAALDGAVRKKR
jgi:hypothetical protein